jgi:excisionase family DNA binding protein
VKAGGPEAVLGGLKGMDDAATELMYRPAEVAARVQVCTRTVMRAIHRGELRASRLGPRAYRIRPEDIDAWIVATTVLPAPEPESARVRPVDGELCVTEEMGRRGHRAAAAAS